ncbi:MAG: hypothetical protein ABI054_05605, partial [Planctomycetota bacterium]
GETWWLGLRLAEGVDPAAARATAGLDASDIDPALAIAARLSDQGLLRMSGDRYCLTERGVPLADFVGSEFLELGLVDRAPSAARG